MSFNITILGSNSALPAYGRNHSAQLLNIQERHFLMDCGEGTQLRILKYKGKYQKINHIFISHLHGDHYLGLMGLIFSMNLNKRTAPLTIYAHKGLDDIITNQLRYSHTSLNFEIIFHRLSGEELLYEDEKLTVSTFPLKHRIPCMGFRFQEKRKPLRIDKEKLPEDMKLQYIALFKQGMDAYKDGEMVFNHKDFTLPPKKSRSFAYCSDTAYYEPVIQHVKDVDLLYHESTFLEEHKERAGHTFHATAKEAATIAKKADVGQLLLGHYSARYRSIDQFKREAGEIFPNTRLALEGETITISEEN